MKFRALDGNWDWLYGRGDNDCATDAQAVAYDLKSKILSWYGDCFFDVTAGIDWKNIIGSKNKKEELDKAIKTIISDQPEVSDLVYFESEIEDRDYKCTIRVKTIYGKTIEVKI